MWSRHSIISDRSFEKGGPPQEKRHCEDNNVVLHEGERAGRGVLSVIVSSVSQVLSGPSVCVPLSIW